MKAAGGTRSVFVLTIITVFLSGCVSAFHVATAPLVFDTEKMGFVGPASATGTQDYLFGVPLSGEGVEDLVHFVKAKTLSKYGGDDLLNPLVEDTSVSFLGIFTRRTVVVSGTVIKFRAVGLSNDGTIKLKSGE